VVVRSGMKVVSFEASVGLLIGAALWFVYRGSVDLDVDRHWIIRMFLFYGAVAMGWAALNLTLILVSDGGGSTLLFDAVQNVYYAYSIIGIVLVIYLGINFFAFTFYKFLDIAKILLGQKPSKEGERAW